MRFSFLNVVRQAFASNSGWPEQWRSPEPKRAYETIIIAAGGHGLATAYYMAKEHGMANIAVLEKGWLGGGNTGRNTTIIRSNYLWEESELSSSAWKFRVTLAIFGVAIAPGLPINAKAKSQRVDGHLRSRHQTVRPEAEKECVSQTPAEPPGSPHRLQPPHDARRCVEHTVATGSIWADGMKDANQTRGVEVPLAASFGAIVPWRRMAWYSLLPRPR